MHKLFLFCRGLLIFNFSLIAAAKANQVIKLTIDYKPVVFSGRVVQALAINNQIPAPTLHFKEGETITLEVFNNLNEETALHWHGLLVPWQMDGVLGVSQQGIKPKTCFTYQFKIAQSGTYWYHAHAGLQEQQGLYGAIIIEPKKKAAYTYAHDEVIVLSDWSNTKPHTILANLKKEGSYYSPRFPLQPSLAQFIQDYHNAHSQNERQNLISDYKMMQQSRMGLYDISDVAFDALLLNGKTFNNPWIKSVKIGDIVRLRFIGAAGSTIFNVKIPGSLMRVIHVQGNDVKPYFVDSFSIAPGETFDVLIKIKKPKPYVIYAESIDTLLKIQGILLPREARTLVIPETKPFPKPAPVMQRMMHLMMEDENKEMLGKMSEHQHHNPMPARSESRPMMHHTMTMPIEPTLIGDHFSSPPGVIKTKGTKYQNLKGLVPTNNPDKAVAAVIKMELFGYMDRFIWFINGKPEYKAKPILLEPNKRYRFIFTNTSMMRHPMHLHGHWFILRNGHGAYDPLLHTLDIPAGATVTADVDTEANGQWFFHCHLLYHMVSGMSRVFQYSTLIDLIDGKIKPQNTLRQTSFINRPIVRIDNPALLHPHLVKHPKGHKTGWFAANFLDIGADPFHHVQTLNFEGLYGPDYHKLQLKIKDAELDTHRLENADIDIFYWHLLSQFWAIKGGINYFNKPAESPYWPIGIGIEGLMPYFIETDLRAYYYRGVLKLDTEFSRDSQMTRNFFVRAEVHAILASKTLPMAQIGSGFNQLRLVAQPYYRIAPGLKLFFQYEYQRNFGVFNRLQIIEGESTVQNTLSFGLSLIF